MSYRCGLCQSVVAPNQPRRTHVIYREAPVADAYRKLPRDRWGAVRMEIAAEIPVCGSCLQAIQGGVDLHELLTIGREVKRQEEQKRQARFALGRGRVLNGQARLKAMVNMTKPLPRFFNSPPIPPVTHSGDRGGNGEKGKREKPKCDICGMDATDGQVTVDTVLCKFHCEKASK